MATTLRQPSFSNLEFSFSIVLKQKTQTNNNHNKSKLAEPRWRRLDNIKLGRGWGWVGSSGTTPFPNQIKGGRISFSRYSEYVDGRAYVPKQK